MTTIDLRHRFNFQEDISPIAGYPERDLLWFWANVLPDLSQFVARDDTLLDVGCAFGHFTRYYAELAARVVGVDFAVERIRLARRHHAKPNIAYHCLDLADTPSPETCTAAVSSAVIQHVPPERRRTFFTHLRASLAGPGCPLLLYDTLRDQDSWDGFFGPLSLAGLPCLVDGLFALQTVVRRPDANSGEPIFRLRLAAM